MTQSTRLLPRTERKISHLVGYVEDLYKFLSDDFGNLCIHLPFIDPVYPMVRYWHRSTLDSWQNAYYYLSWRWYSVVLWPHTPTRLPFAPHGIIWGLWDHATRVVEYTGIYHNIRSLWIYITIPVISTPIVRQDSVFIESNILVLSNIWLYYTQAHKWLLTLLYIDGKTLDTW